MDEINNQSKTNLTDKELIGRESTDKESTDKKSTDKELTNKKSTDKELTDKESTKESEAKTEINSILSSKSIVNSNKQSIEYSLFKDIWILKINLNSRAKLTGLLNQYINLLISDEEILIDEKQSIENNQNELIKLLTRYPLNKESNSYRIFINLDNDLKFDIIYQLMKNFILINHKDKIDYYLKLKLIEQNNSLITELTNQPIEFADNDDNSVDHEESSQLESKDNVTVNQLNEEITNLNCQIINLKEEISELKRKLDDSNSIKLDGCNSIKFCCIKNDLKEFLDFDNNKFTSEPIEFFGIEWLIRIRSKYDDIDKKKYLAFYLVARNEIDDQNDIKWKCTTSYELILKNNSPHKSDRIGKCDNTFNESKRSVGFNKFIECDDLLNLENGYINDDSIKLEVNLRVDKIERIN